MSDIKAKPGTLLLFIALIVLVLNLAMVYYLITLFPGRLMYVPLLVPVLLLDIASFSIVELVFFWAVRKPLLSISKKGLRLKGRHFPWDEVKSISFFKGPRSFLPTVDRIFILDTHGREYSQAIEIKYFSKEGRNIGSARDMLIEQGKVSLISDWAQLQNI